MTGTGRSRANALALLTVSSATLLGGSASAHHTFAPEYEREEMITIEAVVTGVYFRNPHVRLDVVVTTDDGETQTWAANSVSPGAVSHHGWSADTVGVGDRVTLYGNVGSHGSRRLWIQTMTLESGVEIFPVGRLPESQP